MASAEIRALQIMFNDPDIWAEPPVTPPKKQKTYSNAFESSDSEIEIEVTKTTATTQAQSKKKKSRRRPKGPSGGHNNNPSDPNNNTTNDNTEFLSRTDAHEETEPVNLKTGERISHFEMFCPWKLVCAYPELYIGVTNRPKAKPYFDKLLTLQAWDFYYFHPNVTGASPILLVPSAQLSQFLDSVNGDLKTQLCIPVGKVAERFEITFPEPIVPRFLGRTRRPADWDKLVDEIPLAVEEDDAGQLGERQKANFDEMLQMIKESCAPDKSKERRAQKLKFKRVQKRKEWCKAGKRLERYLGLRERENYGHGQTDPSTTSKNTGTCEATQPAPFEFESDVVFVCIDLETYERQPSIVTEVGIACLDTRDLRGVAPGAKAEHWSALIKAYHLRIRERAYMVNVDFVHGCPHRFGFGKSEMVLEEQVDQAIKRSLPSSDRQVVLVGHDVQGDILNLKSVNFNFYKLDNLFDLIDNQEIQQRRLRMANGPSLIHVLQDLHVPFRDLHNAGNDAVYTLQTLLCATVRKCLPKGEGFGAGEAESGEAAAVEAEERGWTSDEGDGGEANKPVDPKPFHGQDR